jgi:hypothetical protein
MKQLRDVQLELSLKPFPSARQEDVEALTRNLVVMWRSLIRHADQLSILLWAGDGTELLEYDRNLDRTFPWALYIGRGSDRHKVPEAKDPNHESLDGYPRPFTAHPNEYTYRDLQRIVRTMKATAEKDTGIKVRIGAILEPGGEFIKSEWKYAKHPECLFSGDGHMGFNIDCTSVLHADTTPYAGFPTGIPEGTPWGTFFGRQAKLFMADMGFEYLWMSNGYGTSRSPYAYGWCGQFFDGKTFFCKGNREVKEKIVQFWKLFRAECPDVPVRLRGTDFVTGMDLVNHATPYRELLDGRFGTTQPPNTPWPALTSNFGMALAGFMGRMSVAEGHLPFRHYTSDPWWANSAWIDSFNRSPHDIYLNLSLAAIRPDGRVKTADGVDFLTVDTSWGELPEWIPDEVIPHIKTGFRHAPDAAGPLVWVYPFDEYEEMTYTSPEKMAQVFAGDLFFQEALSNFLPVNTVVSSSIFLDHQTSGSALSRDRLLITPTPPAGSPMEKALLDAARHGGKVLLYGSLAGSGDALLKALNLGNDVPVSGEFDLSGVPETDRQPVGTDAKRICHQPAICGGGITEVDGGGAGPDTLHTVLAEGQGVKRIVARAVRRGSGILGWVRGTSSVDLGLEVDGGAINLRSMKPFAAHRFFRCEKLLRLMLPHFGYHVALDRELPLECARHLAVSRHRNGFRFALFSEERGMKARLRFPIGAPILEGEPVELRDGAACYRFHRFLYAECRVFVRANDGDRIECKIVQSLHYRFKHRINLTGLKNATVCFFPPDGDPEKAKVLLNPDLRLLTIGDAFESQWIEDGFGAYQEIRNVSGILSIAW